MSRPKFIVAYCGHTSTEEYLARQPLGCCAYCATRMNGAETLKRFEEIRREIKASCPFCGHEISPLEYSTLPVGVFWKTISIEKAAELAINAHIRHVHSDYDECRRALEAEGYDSKEARSMARKDFP